MAFWLGDDGAATAQLRAARALAEQLDDPVGIGFSSYHLGVGAQNRGNLDEAAEHFARARTMATRVSGALAAILGPWSAIQVAVLAYQRCDLAGARAAVADALPLASNEPSARGFLLGLDGWLAAQCGDHERSRASIRASLALLESIRYLPILGYALLYAARAALERAEAATAASHLADLLAILRESENQAVLVLALEGVARLLGPRDPLAALRLLGVAQAERERLGHRPGPFDRAQLDSVLAMARGAVDPESADGALAEGRAMPPELATADALAACTSLAAN
jgi:hypothetical protein